MARKPPDLMLPIPEEWTPSIDGGNRLGDQVVAKNAVKRERQAGEAITVPNLGQSRAGHLVMHRSAAGTDLAQGRSDSRFRRSLLHRPRNHGAAMNW
jgi:hypothetical protein